jgi:hypothetical protein
MASSHLGKCRMMESHHSALLTSDSFLSLIHIEWFCSITGRGHLRHKHDFWPCKTVNSHQDKGLRNCFIQVFLTFHEDKCTWISITPVSFWWEHLSRLSKSCDGFSSLYISPSDYSPSKIAVMETWTCPWAVIEYKANEEGLYPYYNMISIVENRSMVIYCLSRPPKMLGSYYNTLLISQQLFSNCSF